MIVTHSLNLLPQTSNVVIIGPYCGQSFLFQEGQKRDHNTTLLRNGHYCIPTLCVQPKDVAKGSNLISRGLESCGSVSVLCGFE